MIMLALITTFIALMPLSTGYFQTVNLAEPLTVTKSTNMLGNFLAYRAAVQTYTDNNQAFTGTVQDTALNLPIGYQKLGPWTNQITALQTVVYGSSNIGMIGASTLSNDSIKYGATYAVGYAKNGNWVSTTVGSITIAPNYVPDGSVLSIINRQ